MNLHDVVKKIIGETKPVGETNADIISFENLKVLTDLVEELLTDIDYIATNNKGRVEYSMQRSGQHCSEFLDRIGIEQCHELHEKTDNPVDTKEDCSCRKVGPLRSDGMYECLDCGELLPF